jgi:hypothetical protein
MEVTQSAKTGIKKESRFNIIGLTTAEMEIIQLGIVNTREELSGLESCEDQVSLCNDLYLKIDEQLIISKS